MSVKEHTLIYANKTPEDILFPVKLNQTLGKKCVYVLSQSKSKSAHFGRIHQEVLEPLIHNLQQYFYICGPRLFEKEIAKQLIKIGVRKRFIQTGYKF
jgi:ferredoxin-NADP reductase